MAARPEARVDRFGWDEDEIEWPSSSREKAFDEHLHPRDNEGRFTETADFDLSAHSREVMGRGREREMLTRMEGHLATDHHATYESRSGAAAAERLFDAAARHSQVHDFGRKPEHAGDPDLQAQHDELRARIRDLNEQIAKRPDDAPNIREFGDNHLDDFTRANEAYAAETHRMQQEAEKLAAERLALWQRIQGAKNFSERLHPRDEHGRFAETAGGGSIDISRLTPGERDFALILATGEGSEDERIQEFFASGQYEQSGDAGAELARRVGALPERPKARIDEFVDHVVAYGDEETHITFATVRGEHVGRLDWSLQDVPGRITIEDIYVREDMRGQGVGRALLERVHAQHPDLKFTYGDVSEQGRALIESLPHEWVGRRVGGSRNVTSYDDHPQTLELSPSEQEHLKSFDEHLHPRDEHGRFAEIGSLGDTAITQGGFSLSLAGDRPKHGWMVSKLGSERSFSVEGLAEEQDMEFVPGSPWHDNLTREIDRFVADHLSDLGEDGAYLGGWIDSERLFLDVSYNFDDEEEARAFAEDNAQFAMFNAETGEYREFEQTRRAAARDGGVRDRAKVLLKVLETDRPEDIARRLHEALFS